MSIAVFDSGVGGISVLKSLVEVMPNEDFIYYGDSANAPYGTKTHSLLIRPKLLLNLTDRLNTPNSFISTRFTHIEPCHIACHKKTSRRRFFIHAFTLKIWHGGTVAEAVGAKIASLHHCCF